MEVFGCGFVQLYGMTETTGSVTALGPEDHDLAGNPRMISAGKALPNVELAIDNAAGDPGLFPAGRPLLNVELVILDAARDPLPDGTVGEVAVRSMTNMQGYWKLPQ